MNTAMKGREGFTLVELAIVLVIIGLLVGGVLVGQDLIKAATIRSTVSDIEKVNAAATTFRTKYSGIPGDILSSRANEYGLKTGTGRTGAAGMGDGNGLVEGCAANSVNIGCESALFWVDLSTAALIPQRLATYDSTATTVTGVATSAAAANYLPKQKLRDTAMLDVFPTAGKNFLYLGNITAIASGVPTLAAGVSGGEARSIDEKFDDAFPLSGVVESNELVTTPALGKVDTFASAASATSCVNGTATPVVYNVVDANINNVNCSLMLRTSF
jgi:prepilin-type N-terminal cleavage/methylation domain-containing protein